MFPSRKRLIRPWRKNGHLQNMLIRSDHVHFHFLPFILNQHGQFNEKQDRDHRLIEHVLSRWVIRWNSIINVKIFLFVCYQTNGIDRDKSAMISFVSFCLLNRPKRNRRKNFVFHLLETRAFDLIFSSATVDKIFMRPHSNNK